MVVGYDRAVGNHPDRRFARAARLGEPDSGRSIVRPVTPASNKAVPGVIETLSAGFDQVNRVLWVVALPVLVDLFLWLGPRLSSGRVFDEIGRWYNSMVDTYASVAGGVDAGSLDQARQAVSSLQAQAGQFNLLSLLVINIASVPSVLPPTRE